MLLRGAVSLRGCQHNAAVRLPAPRRCALAGTVLPRGCRHSITTAWLLAQHRCAAAGATESGWRGDSVAVQCVLFISLFAQRELSTT